MLVLCLLAGVAAADPDPKQVLKGLEDRYNRAKTLQVQFQETYTLPGRQRRSENGQLTLRKPGRMRWDYAAPAGKVFVSDGKMLFLYTPASKKLEKMKVKESEDMRVPLAFLLGKLDFNRDFQNFQVKQDGDAVSIQADPKSDKLAFKQVTFLVSGKSEIRKVTILGQDQSLLEFTFKDEQLNPKVDDAIFRYAAPEGAEVVDMTSQTKGAE